MYVDFIKKFHLADSKDVMAVRLISSYSTQKTFDSYFLEMMYVEFIENFYLIVSNQLMTVSLISASWKQKRYPFILDMVTSCSWKIFISPFRTS